MTFKCFLCFLQALGELPPLVNTLAIEWKWTWPSSSIISSPGEELLRLFFCFIFFSRRGERSCLVFLGEWFPYTFYHYRDLLGFVFYCFRKISLLYHHSNLFTYLFNFSCWIIYSIVSFNWIYSSYQDHSRFIIFYGVAKIHWLNCVHHLL